MMGDFKENVKTFLNVFQPNLNTRFSGVIFCTHGYNSKGDFIEFEFITNPHAKFPVSEEFKLLFQK